MPRWIRKRSKAVRRRLTITAMVSLLVVAFSIRAAVRSRSVSEWLTIDASPVISYQVKMGSQDGWVDLSLLAVPKLKVLPAARKRIRYERIELGAGSLSSVQNRVLGRGVRVLWLGILIAEFGLAFALLFWSDRKRSSRGSSSPTRKGRKPAKRT